jgi:assimilatory nitrate reductase electron transfer subunit
MTRVVVVGNGMVGSRFVEDLLAADRAGRHTVTVLGAEHCEPYNRVLLSEVVAGRYDLSSLTLPTPDHARLTVRRGAAATGLDREDRVVLAADGSRHRYDLLVLATGASARIPPLAGLPADPAQLPRGVHPLRTIDDAREIVAATLNARRAVVLGAGVLGLEAACGLAARGVAVTVVHPAAALMERQLDGDASRVVEAAMTSIGIDHRVGVGAETAIIEDGALRGLRLADGEVVAAELLVLATGTMANTELASSSGLRTDRGVLVTDDLASVDDRRVFAIGDCAQPPEGGSGLVAQGWEQSRRLASALCAANGTGTASAQSVPAPVAALDAGRESPASGGGNDVVRLKSQGIDVVTMGVCGSQRPDHPAQRQLRLSDPAAGRHVEIVVSDGVLVGATCVGAGPVAVDLVAAYTRRTPLPADPAYLLLPALAGAGPAVAPTPEDLPDSATVCRCNGVSKSDIVDHWELGCTGVDDIAAATRATTGCGGCTEDVCGLLSWLDRTRPAADTSPTTAADRENRFTSGKHALHGTETRAL